MKGAAISSNGLAFHSYRRSHISARGKQPAVAQMSLSTGQFEKFSKLFDGKRTFALFISTIYIS